MTESNVAKQTKGRPRVISVVWAASVKVPVIQTEHSLSTCSITLGGAFQVNMMMCRQSGQDGCSTREEDPASRSQAPVKAQTDRKGSRACGSWDTCHKLKSEG